MFLPPRSQEGVMYVWLRYVEVANGVGESHVDELGDHGIKGAANFQGLG